MGFGEALAFTCLRGGVVHLKNTDLQRAMGIPESESVESGAKDDDLPNPLFDGFRQSIFRKAASRGGEETSDARQGVLVRKLKHVLFVLTQNHHGKWVVKDGAMIEHLMSSSMPGDHEGGATRLIRVHVRGLRSVDQSPIAGVAGCATGAE